MAAIPDGDCRIQRPVSGHGATGNASFNGSRWATPWDDHRISRGSYLRFFWRRAYAIIFRRNHDECGEGDLGGKPVLARLAPCLALEETGPGWVSPFWGISGWSRVTNYVWNNVDYMLIGRLLVAKRLVLQVGFRNRGPPAFDDTTPSHYILYPAFAAKQSDNAALRKGFLEMIRLLASLVAPMMIGLCAVAPWAVAAVFGPKWAPVAVLLQILSLWAYCGLC